MPQSQSACGRPSANRHENTSVRIHGDAIGGYISLLARKPGARKFSLVRRMFQGEQFGEWLVRSRPRLVKSEISDVDATDVFSLMFDT
jgi:hypothetical protein